MDFEEIINGWIDRALSTDSVLHNVDHHFNIRYSPEPAYTNKSLLKELVGECVAKKRKAAAARSRPSNKAQRRSYPDLVNKTILHKWMKEGKEQWIRGKVVKVLGDTDDIECDYEIPYVDENELLTVKLHEDLENNYLVIL